MPHACNRCCPLASLPVPSRAEFTCGKDNFSSSILCKLFHFVNNWHRRPYCDTRNIYCPTTQPPVLSHYNSSNLPTTLTYVRWLFIRSKSRVPPFSRAACKSHSQPVHLRLHRSSPTTLYSYGIHVRRRLKVDKLYMQILFQKYI